MSAAAHKVVGKSDVVGLLTTPAWRASAAILEALNAGQTQRVIVIAHSQGTIIAANVLRAVAKALHLPLRSAG